MKNTQDVLIETYAYLYSQKENVGMDTHDNMTNNGWREEEVTSAPGQANAG